MHLPSYRAKYALYRSTRWQQCVSLRHESGASTHQSASPSWTSRQPSKLSPITRGMWRALLSHAFEGLLVTQTAISATGRESGSRAYEEEEEEASAAW